MVYQAIVKPGYELLKVKNSQHDFPVHFHKRLCIGKVVSGNKYLRIYNHENVVSKNCVYIIPPYVAHSCKTDGNSEYLVFSLEQNEVDNLKVLSEGAKFLGIGIDKIVELTNDIYNYGSIKNNIVNYILNPYKEWTNSI